MNANLKQDALQTVDKVYESIKQNALVDSGEKILVALSGGADSVALLFILNRLSEKLNVQLFAAHLNHE